LLLFDREDASIPPPTSHILEGVLEAAIELLIFDLLPLHCHTPIFPILRITVKSIKQPGFSYTSPCKTLPE
jgi:hypothetical protein